MTNADVWTYHVLAGIIGVILSLSAFYQLMERKLSSHRQIRPGDVLSIEGARGQALDDVEQQMWIDRFNSLVYMGKSPRVREEGSKTTVHLRNGERLEIHGPTAYGKHTAYHVLRIRRRGRPVHYWLVERESSIHHPLV
ncbi:MAG: hypothetical protein K6T83_07265 [Alicyclobacillus sp.]|nr:hypothetical protein [Alicyclobacillus sp.]